MARMIFVGSALACLLFVGLSQVPDPGVLGIHDEPTVILFYGGSGLLAGLSGLIALGSGAYVGATRFTRLSESQRRLILATMWILLLIVLIAFAVRFIPVW